MVVVVVVVVVGSNSSNSSSSSSSSSRGGGGGGGRERERIFEAIKRATKKKERKCYVDCISPVYSVYLSSS